MVRFIKFTVALGATRNTRSPFPLLYPSKVIPGAGPLIVTLLITSGTGLISRILPLTLNWIVLLPVAAPVQVDPAVGVPSSALIASRRLQSLFPFESSNVLTVYVVAVAVWLVGPNPRKKLQQTVNDRTKMR